MITETLINVWGDFILFFLNDMEPMETPGWLSQAAGFMSTIFVYAGQLGVWMNWGLLGVVVLGLIAVNVFSFGVHAVRMVLSFFTGGGGKA